MKTKIYAIIILVLFLVVLSFVSAQFFQQSNQIPSPENSMQQPPSQTQTPPLEAINACAQKSVDDSCSFVGGRGETVNGVCGQESDDEFACSPSKETERIEPREELVEGSNKKSRGFFEIIFNFLFGWLKGDDAGEQEEIPDRDERPLPDKEVKQEPDNFYDPEKSSYSIEQAISDRAQESTIGYDALAFLTGNLCTDSFIPPGKVADFFGYQYLRDVTQEGQGHSTDFVTNSANNVLYILNDEQKQKLIDTAEIQVETVNQYAYNRYPLMVAFRRQFDGDISAGKTELSKETVIDYSEELYLLDAEISIQRAKLFGEIINSLDDDQIVFLDAMVEGGFASWTPREDQVDKESMSHDEHVLVMTFASEMFGWYAGDVESDTYFAPERQGTYFGSFYMKDAPAIGKAGYVIDETITADKGDILLDYLEDDQSKLISDLVDIQRDNLKGIVEVRRAISTELRKFQVQESIDEELVMSLAKQYGAYDGEDVYYFAMHFSEVFETLTDAQKQYLMELRDLDDYPCEDGKIYLYSEKIDKPEIQNTDFLFE